MAKIKSCKNCKYNDKQKATAWQNWTYCKKFKAVFRGSTACEHYTKK